MATAIEFIKRIKDPEIREIILNDIINKSSFEDGSDSETFKQVNNWDEAVTCIWWHRTDEGYDWYSNIQLNPPELLPEPTEREREEELLREYDAYIAKKVRFVMPENTATDFLNQRKNK